MSLLIGCGQMGPLYLPDQEPPIKVAKPKPTSSSPAIS
jgi:predicted small lipoprotein YifL